MVAFESDRKAPGLAKQRSRVVFLCLEVMESFSCHVQSIPHFEGMMQASVSRTLMALVTIKMVGRVK